MPKSEATLKVYESEVVLSEAAVKMLGLEDDSPFVIFMEDRDAERSKHRRLYVAKATAPWPMKYPSVRKGHRRTIRCRDLCRQLALLLDGPGTYRICEEDSYTEFGITWYNIFFRRYD